MECKDFMSKLMKKTMEKSLLKFLLAQNMSSLDPMACGFAVIVTVKTVKICLGKVLKKSLNW